MSVLPWLLSCTAAVLAQAPAADPLAELRFLVGHWQMVEADGSPGIAGAGEFSFTAELGGRVLVRRSFAEYPAQGGRPAFRHEDLMSVYADGGALKALYLDNEGHAIAYDVVPLPAGGGVRFTSTGDGPRFRMEYRPGAAGTVGFTFDTAAPGKAFTTYLKASVRRRP